MKNEAEAVIKAFEEAVRAERSKKITDDMTVAVAIRPLILSQMMWHYALLASEYAKDNRIYALIKQNRELRNLYASYKDYVAKVLGAQGLEKIAVYATDFLNTFDRDLELFYWPANQVLKNTGDAITHERMRTYAFMSIYLCRLAIRVEEDARADVRRETGCSVKTIIPQMLFVACVVLSKFVGEDTFCKIEVENIHLRRALDVLNNDLRLIKSEG